MLVIVETILLLTTFLIVFDLSIISAPSPISAAFRKIRVFLVERSFAFVTVALMTSIFLAFPVEKLRQHSMTPSGNPNDLASTFLVPHGNTAITASGFIGFRTDDDGTILLLLLAIAALLLLAPGLLP